MSPALRRGLLVFLAGLALLAGAFSVDYWWAGAGSAGGGLGGIAIGGPFTLTDQNGRVRSDQDFRGSLMLVYFGYTYCPDACPTALQTMSSALDLLGDAGKAVQPIFITVDPARDTVAQMKLYAGNFHPRLVALTGTPAETAAAANAYRIYFAKVDQGGGNDYLVDHSSLVLLMDRDGRYLTHFTPEATPESMAKAIKSYL
jgi:cytochrome oxidase Cu insertion factor (SCO1/SenC/PrrC family)